MTSADILLTHDIRNILNNGYKDENPRPKYADGTPAHTLSVNHVVRKYNLQKEFPICSLRPIAWKSAIKEIFWIYHDESNSLDVLNNKYGVHYWNQWESIIEPGTIGLRYGATVGRHNLMCGLLDDIIDDPYGRRHIMSLWQEEDFYITDGLLPCAFLTIWNVRKYKDKEYLDLALIQRSGDMLAASGAGGINEVQYAALQMMVAKATGYKPGVFTHFVANEQIYDRHMEQANELLSRADRQLKIREDKSPFCYYDIQDVRLEFNPKTNYFYDFSIDDFEMKNYEPVKPQLTLDLGI